jgi:hypothetical protein
MTQALIQSKIAEFEAPSTTSAMAAIIDSKAAKAELVKSVDMPIVSHELWQILVEKFKKEGYNLKPAYILTYLRATPDLNLGLAFKAINDDIQARTRALNDSGRMSVVHELAVLKNWNITAAKYHNTLLEYLEDEETQLKELPTLGWKSSLGLHLKSLAGKGHYQNPEYCMAGLFEYHNQLNSSRVRRAMFYYQLRQQNLPQKELEDLMMRWDIQQNNLLHVVPTSETPAQHDARLTRLNRARFCLSIPITAEEEQQIQDVLDLYQMPCADAKTREDPFLGVVSEVIKECGYEKAEIHAKVRPTSLLSFCSNVRQPLGHST